MKILLIVPSLFLILLIQSCSTTEPIPVNENIKIAEIDAAVIEVYLNIQIENPSPNKEVVIERDGQRVISFTASKTDTAITDTGLTENTLYKYKAKLQEKGKVIGESTEVSVTTLLPTSHNFTWETFTFGEHGSSVIYDVAIVNKNDIWAVGQIYMRDSTGQLDYQPYNAAHWDGSKWELERILFYTICGQQDRTPYPIKSVLITSENDIWFAMDGSEVVNFNGEVQIRLDCTPISINELWGINSLNIYAVGNFGGVAHYNGASWEKLNNISEMYLADIYGNSNSIYVAGSNINYGKGLILKGSDTNFEIFVESDIITQHELFNPKLFGSISAVWLDEKNTLYAGGDILYRYKFGKWDYVKSLPQNNIRDILNVNYRGYINAIRGMASNDMWIAGDRNTLRHFNGKTWQQIGLPYDPQSHILWSSVEAKNDVAVAVGLVDYKAMIIIMSR